MCSGHGRIRQRARGDGLPDLGRAWLRVGSLSERPIEPCAGNGGNPARIGGVRSIRTYEGKEEFVGACGRHARGADGRRAGSLMDGDDPVHRDSVGGCDGLRRGGVRRRTEVACRVQGGDGVSARRREVPPSSSRFGAGPRTCRRGLKGTHRPLPARRRQYGRWLCPSHFLLPTPMDPSASWSAWRWAPR